MFRFINLHRSLCKFCKAHWCQKGLIPGRSQPNNFIRLIWLWLCRGDIRHLSHSRWFCVAVGRKRIPFSEIKQPIFILSIVVMVVPCVMRPETAYANSFDSLIERLDKLEAENRQLRKEVEELKAKATGSKTTELQVATHASGGGG